MCTVPDNTPLKIYKLDFAKKKKNRNQASLTLSPVETCFHKAHMNLYGVFILGVNIKYGLSFVFLGSKVAYTSERVNQRDHKTEILSSIFSICTKSGRWLGFVSQHFLIICQIPSGQSPGASILPPCST